ncbi:unnamed protein product [Camellia sinensis]
MRYSPLAPQWYRLEHRKGETKVKGEEVCVRGFNWLRSGGRLRQGCRPPEGEEHQELNLALIPCKNLCIID